MRKQNMMVSLDLDTENILNIAGKGNRSLGVRVCAAFWMQERIEQDMLDETMRKLKAKNTQPVAVVDLSEKYERYAAKIRAAWPISEKQRDDYWVHYILDGKFDINAPVGVRNFESPEMHKLCRLINNLEADEDEAPQVDDESAPRVDDESEPVDDTFLDD